MIDITKFTSVSFALEGVLTDEFDGETNPQKEEMQTLLKECIKHGKKVTIFSRRYGPDAETYPFVGYGKKPMKLTKENKIEHETGDKLIKEIVDSNHLSIDNIYTIYTSRNPYVSFTKGNWSNHAHFDSSGYEIIAINDNYGDLIKTFNITQENWKEYEHGN